MVDMLGEVVAWLIQQPGHAVFVVLFILVGMVLRWVWVRISGVENTLSWHLNHENLTPHGKCAFEQAHYSSLVDRLDALHEDVKGLGARIDEMFNVLLGNRNRPQS